ncbi:MAG: HisS family protein [Nanoarchaeota archaeon]|nr:HisS family protein [Nanoarchaeota archaeon]
MKTDLVKGFKDYTGEEAIKRAEVRKIIIDNFEKYGFEPAETPVVEYEEFVKGENQNDEAVSDIFKLKDKGERELALRYEFTFQLKRLMQNKKLPYKRYQIGEVFRDEPVSTNRFRQFVQCDIDTIGSTIKDEAEILSLVNDVMKQLKIKPIILINNRKLINEILNYEKIKDKDKMQVLREIDKYDKLPEKEVKNNLKKYGADKMLNDLKKGETFFNKFDSYKEILELINLCKNYGLKIIFSPTIVRGLSYYNSSVFEVKAEGIKETIAAGGSYMFNGIQCTGLAFGLDRLSLLSNPSSSKERILIVSLGQDKESIKLAQKLRNEGKSVIIYYGKPSKALEYANSYSIQNVIFIGEKEIKEKKFKIKDLKTGKEKELKI